MTITTRFGKKLNVPSTFQIKHQLLLFWLKNQIAKEAAEAKQTRVSLAGRITAWQRSHRPQHVSIKKTSPYYKTVEPELP